jgi:hypothetical protein
MLDFSGGTVYLTSAARDIAWDSQTWSATGGAMSFEAVQETSDLAGQGVKVILDGVTQATISALLSDHYIGHEAKLYLAHLDTDGSVIADPVLLFHGYMNDAWTIKEKRDPSGGVATVETRLVSPLVRLQQVRGIKANQTSHETHYANDTFMRHISALREQDLGWGVGLLAPGWLPWSTL